MKRALPLRIASSPFFFSEGTVYMEQPPWVSLGADSGKEWVSGFRKELGIRAVFEGMFKQGDDWALCDQEVWGSQDKHMHTRPWEHCSQAENMK